MPLAIFQCPTCGKSQQALPSSQVMHECPKNKNRVTVFLKKADTNE